MKKLLSALTFSTLLIACLAPTSAIIGQEKDANGCLVSAGQSYSFLKKECVQVFNVADITLTDPENDSLAVYIIFSEDRTQAEVFASDLPENTILEAVKGGYLSKDSKIRLLKTDNYWKIRK
ncbi:hypothetical protein PTQ27_03100 [Mannheimia sp. AT1]|uniref:Lipoprotein n=1 Tax=Mannheimia cairinae TaxID=3025936 RepID=A0ABT5MMP6_9PAST|nr:hypothetical protein [Mannheimia cairinae]MDD0823459.1 hypothetical protein [Mannheimia cairinae]MDD0826933.1 hypothetical protein [Mannheimia cairinae]